MSKKFTTSLTGLLTTAVGSLALCSAMTLCYADHQDLSEKIHSAISAQEAQAQDSETADSSTDTASHVETSDHDDVNQTATDVADSDANDASADGTDADDQDQDSEDDGDDSNIFTIQDNNAANDD